MTTSPVGPDSALLGRLSDPGADVRVLHRAHDAFVSSGETSGVRDLVAESWLRSVAAGMDPERAVAEMRLAEDDLREIREAHPLTAVMPVIRRLLVEEAADAGLLVAVSDAAGQLLYVEGPSALRSSAESMHFMPGGRLERGRRRHQRPRHRTRARTPGADPRRRAPRPARDTVELLRRPGP